MAAWQLAPLELYPFIRILDLWKSKKGRIAWETLSSSISSVSKTALRNKYLRQADIAMIFALLSILEGGKDGADDKLAEICQTYRLIVESWETDNPLCTAVRTYLSIGAAELCEYGRALERSLDCRLWNVKEEIYKHVIQALNLMISVSEEIWTSEPVLLDEGVVQNTACFNR